MLKVDMSKMVGVLKVDVLAAYHPCSAHGLQYKSRTFSSLLVGFEQFKNIVQHRVIVNSFHVIFSAIAELLKLASKTGATKLT